MRCEHRDWLSLFIQVPERLDSNLLPRLSVITGGWRGVGTMSSLRDGMQGREMGGPGRATGTPNGVCGVCSGNGDDPCPE